MKDLYGSVNISKHLGKNNLCIKECISYYKLKNEKYGLEIVKKDDANEEKIEIANVRNITDNEEKINKILNVLIIKKITPDSSDVIEDLLKIYV